MTTDSEIRFDGQVAVITGAGGGLGRAYALAFAERGACVVVNDFGGSREGMAGGEKGPADRVVDEIRAMGGKAAANYADISTEEGGASVVQTAMDHFGRIDILINNAGILRDKTMVKMDAESWNTVMGVHLNGAYHVTRPAVMRMREQGYGRIIFTTSAAGLYGNFGQTNYAAAKSGLLGFMQALKLEGEKYNIRVNAIAPLAASRMTQDLMPPDLLAKMKPEYVTPLVLYLCSAEAQESGAIFNAGFGFFNRTAMVSGPGTFVGTAENPPTPEAVRSRWTDICSLSDAREYRDLGGIVMDILSSPAMK